MHVLFGVAVWVVFLGLFFWAINALSVLRLQMDDVIARLDRIERGQKGGAAHRAT